MKISDLPETFYVKEEVCNRINEDAFENILRPYIGKELKAGQWYEFNFGFKFEKDKKKTLRIDSVIIKEIVKRIRKQG